MLEPQVLAGQPLAAELWSQAISVLLPSHLKPSGLPHTSPQQPAVLLLRETGHPRVPPPAPLTKLMDLSAFGFCSPPSLLTPWKPGISSSQLLGFFPSQSPISPSPLLPLSVGHICDVSILTICPCCCSGYLHEVSWAICLSVCLSSAFLKTGVLTWVVSSSTFSFLVPISHPPCSLTAARQSPVSPTTLLPI